MFNGNAPSLADIAAVTRNNDNDGFGGNNGWWILIILFALFGGWGGNWGGAGMASQGGAVTRTDLCSEFNFNNLTRDVSDLRSDMIRQNNYAAQGFSGINTAIVNEGHVVRDSIQQGQIAQMQSFNGLQAQLSDCCCGLKTELGNLKFDLASQHQALQTAIFNATQQIMQNDNANYRQLHDENVAIQMEAKNAQIADLQRQLNQCGQNNQTATILAAIAEQKKSCGC